MCLHIYVYVYNMHVKLLELSDPTTPRFLLVFLLAPRLFKVCIPIRFPLPGRLPPIYYPPYPTFLPHLIIPSSSHTTTNTNTTLFQHPFYQTPLPILPHLFSHHVAPPATLVPRILFPYPFLSFFHHCVLLSVSISSSSHATFILCYIPRYFFVA